MKSDIIVLEPLDFGEEVHLEVGGNAFILRGGDGVEFILEDGQAMLLSGALAKYLDGETPRTGRVLTGKDVTVTAERVNGFLSGVFWTVVIYFLYQWIFT